jgi:hypothetical protein
VDKAQLGVDQRVNQCDGVTDLAPIPECVVSVRVRSVGVAKQPQSHRAKGQDCHPDVLAELRCQRTMLGWIVKSNRLIVVRPAFHDTLNTVYVIAVVTRHNCGVDVLCLRAVERTEALGEPPEDPLLLFSVLYGAAA